MPRRFSGVVLFAMTSVACSTAPSGPSGPEGGPVPGAVDEHCSIPGIIKQATDPGACHPPTSKDLTPKHGDAGTVDEYGPTMNNAEGDDDQCKYHVKFSVKGARKGDDATFTITTTRRVDDAPLTGAHPRAEVYLDETHPAPNSDQHAIEVSPGTYTVGPVRFDASGYWTVRFHFFEECSDGDTSPHGHAAFYVKVP